MRADICTGLRQGLVGLSLIYGMAASTETRTVDSRVDARAAQLLTKTDSVMDRAQSLVGEAVREEYMPDGRLNLREVYRERMRKPNIFRLETYRAQMTVRETPEGRKVVMGEPELAWMTASDGITQASGVGTFTRAPARSRPRLHGSPLLERLLVLPEDLFFDSEWSAVRLREAGLISLQYRGTERWRDTTYEVVDWIYRNRYLAPEDDLIDTARIYINSQHVISRIRTVTSKRNVIDDFIQSLALDAPVTASDGVVVDTAEAKPAEVSESKAEGPRPLKVGDVAPMFALGTARGDTFSLARTLARGRGVVLFVWHYG
jgi:hypothetical protein